MCEQIQQSAPDNQRSDEWDSNLASLFPGAMDAEDIKWLRTGRDGKPIERSDEELMFLYR